MANIYGRDLACVPNASGVLDLTDAMTEVTGLDVLVQSIVRRHVTSKGSDPASPNDGIDVRTWINKGMTQKAVSLLAATVQKELIRDQRVLPSTTVTAALNTETMTITFTEVIQTNAGPFSLTIAIDQVTVDVLVNGG